jgi:hypothetical protein
MENEVRVSDELYGLPQVRSFPDAPQNFHRLRPRPLSQVVQEFVELCVLICYLHSLLQVGRVTGQARLKVVNAS